ncbi:hypothetical protein Phou_048220 [Phytohabitans houttuyneae]|uniref:Uncharacterized protein n=1 Tax=Phytohabitans houttuyneae TaxID=1076126 RepID=A0A6V8K615_9ACTN|nr:hypothetical protein Phou_048220 [Phytohabitans houttuyneae]
MRVPVVVLGVEADQLQQLAYPLLDAARRADPVYLQRHRDDPPDGVPRVQRGVRVLEDDLQVLPQQPQPAPPDAADVPPLEDDPAAGRLQQAHEHPPRGRLATARLADEPERLAARHLEVDPVDGAHQAAPTYRKVLGQPFHLEQRAGPLLGNVVSHSPPRAVTGDKVPVRHLAQLGHLGAGPVVGVGAAGMERAPRRQVDQAGRAARDRHEVRVRVTVEGGHACQQPPGVRVLRPPQHVLDAAVLDGPSAVHDEHLVGHLADHAQVVGDQHDRRVELLLEIFEQVQDLRLHGHVERGRRLVGDEQVGVVDEGHRDHRPLPHAAGELVRVLPRAPRRLRDAHPVEHLDGALARLAAAGARVVDPVRFGDLPAHRVVRVQGREGVLEDHRHVAATQAAYLLIRTAHDIAAADEDLAGDGRALRVVQPEHREARDALSGAGLADDAERPAALDRERHSVDRTHHPVFGGKPNAQVTHLEVRVGGRSHGTSPS